jgi:hypothetical protein
MRTIERVSYTIAAVLFASGLFHLAVYAVDGGPWEGPVSWRKPVTFGLSFGVVLATIAWVASYVALSPRTRNWVLGAFAAASVAEVALISLQRWRGVPSHLNDETVFDAVVARTLAAGGGVLIITIVWLTVAAFRPNPATAPSLRLAVCVGLGSLVGALAVGAAMIARGMLLVAAGDRTAAYAQMGGLKPAHAALMHGVTVLPVLAWLAARTRWPEHLRVRVIALAAAGYLTAAGAVVAGTVADALTAPAVLVVAALGLVALGAAGAVTVAGVVRERVPAGIGVR